MADSKILRLGRDASDAKQWAGKDGKLLAAADLVYSDRATRYASAEFDVTRATTGTFVNAEGLIEVAQANVPRVDYLNSTKGELLVEEQRTNLLTYSEDFSNAAWTKVNSTISTNAGVAPDGTTTADNFIPDATNTEHRVDYFSTGIAAGKGANSFFVKPNGYSVVQITTLSSDYVNYDLETLNVFESSATVEGSIIPYPNGWFRVSFVDDYTGVTDRARISIVPNISSTRFENFTGDGTSGIYIWGAQLEEGSYASSYIPTEASTVTRNADVISLSNAEELLGDSEGSVLFEGSLFAESGDLRITLNDGTANNRNAIRFTSGNITLLQTVSGTNVVNEVGSAYFANTVYKIATRYALNDFALYLDGAQDVTSSSGSVFLDGTLNTLTFSTAPFYGRIRELRVYDTALTNAELAALTS